MTHRVFSADWWVLTIANAAATSGLSNVQYNQEQYYCQYLK
jgi:hypothetical protein